MLKRPVVVAQAQARAADVHRGVRVLRAAAPTAPLKVTLINAQQAAAYYDAEKSKGAYPTIDAYLADVVDILRAEVDELVRLGCTYIQLDAPQYAGLIDPAIREGYRKRGTDPDRLLDRCIELDNAVIGDHPGVTFGIHLCRGNNQSKFYASGGYDPIVRRCSSAREFDRFLLEYDDERSGGFEPLRHVPEDRTVVLGLVTTKKPALESEGRAEAAHRGGRAATCRWSGWRSARSAASPRPRRATCSARATRRPSCGSSRRWRSGLGRRVSWTARTDLSERIPRGGAEGASGRPPRRGPRRRGIRRRDPSAGPSKTLRLWMESHSALVRATRPGDQSSAPPPFLRASAWNHRRSDP